MGALGEWLRKQKSRTRIDPPDRLEITFDSVGFQFKGIQYDWSSISAISIDLADFLTTDSIYVELKTDLGHVVLSEDTIGFYDCLSVMNEKFPEIERPIQYLSHHPFSREIFVFNDVRVEDK
jgi:hypothetical protein